MNFLRKTSHVSSFLQVSYFPVSFVTAWLLKNEIRFKIKMIKFWNKSLVTNISCVHLLFFPFFIIFCWKYFFLTCSHLSSFSSKLFVFFFCGLGLSAVVLCVQNIMLCTMYIFIILCSIKCCITNFYFYFVNVV